MDRVAILYKNYDILANANEKIAEVRPGCFSDSIVIGLDRHLNVPVCLRCCLCLIDYTHPR